MIGDPEAAHVLGAARDHANGDSRSDWDRRLRLWRAVRGGDGRAIVEAYDGGQVRIVAGVSLGGCERFRVDLLASVVDVERLSGLAAAYRAKGMNGEAELVTRAFDRARARTHSVGQTSD